jgi:membrane associated rhomboid family serine protease
MIPLRDSIPSRRFPVVNTLLIVANVLVFLFEVSMGPQALNRFIVVFGAVPARFWAVGGPAAWLTIFTSMFLHGGWLHLLSNMLALYIFGDNVEDRMGHGRYLVFYLLGGVLAGLAHLIAYAPSEIPTVGASGAIAAILGAYLVLYPRSRVLTLIFVFIFVQVIEIPAVVYLGFWFLSQLLSGSLALAANTFQGGGVAWWAHIGGFVGGAVLVRLFTLGRRSRGYDPYDYYRG